MSTQRIYDPIGDLIEKLRGTCDTGDDELIAKLHPADRVRIDQEIGRCDQCGWWHGVDEIRTEGAEKFCVECLSEADPDQTPAARRCYR